MLKLHLTIIVACGALLASVPAQAASTATTEIIVSGTVTIPPCEVNSNAALDVDFGSMPLSGQTGPDGAYQKVQSVPVVCTYYQGTPHVKLTGTVHGGTTSCIATNITDFCINFYQGEGTGTEMVVGPGANNNGYPITAGLTGANTASGAFSFTMVPNRLAANLQAGAFNATATMSIIYN
ncbi:fimbrial protein [Enterobacter mori]|uniref:fimbrial protein n=1 Tax=Enterobacter mori TaxID=539813 RepID=UPI003B842C1E